MDDLNELTDEQLAGWKAQNQAVLDRDTLSDPEKLRGLSDDELTGLKQRQHEVLLAPFREQARAGQGAYSVGEGTGSYLGRQFVSPLRSIPMGMAYGVAKDRLNRNEHSDSDLRAIAAYEHEQGLDQAQPEWAKWAGVAAAAPGTVAEFGLAPGVAFGLHGTAGAIAQGGLNAESLLKGGATAAVQIGVLKSLGPIASKFFPQAEGVLATAGTHALTGTAGLALADYGTKIVGLSEHGGPIADFLEGKYGEMGRGLMANAILTGGTGAFDAIQKGMAPKAATERAAEQVQAVAKAVDHGSKQGMSPQAATDRVSRIMDFAKKPGGVKADMPIDQMADGPLKDLGRLVQKTLPDAVAVPSQGVVRAVYADKPITLKMDPDGTVDVSFKHDPRSGKVGIAEEQPNSAAMGFGRKLLGLVKGLGEAGVSLKYQTLDESGQFDTDKARSYASALTRAGYERVSEPAEGDPGGFHVWKPKAETPVAPTLKTEPSEPRPEPVNASQPAPEAPGASNAKAMMADAAASARSERDPAALAKNSFTAGGTGKVTPHPYARLRDGSVVRLRNSGAAGEYFEPNGNMVDATVIDAWLGPDKKVLWERQKAGSAPSMSADEARGWLAFNGLKAPESDAVAIAKAEKLVAEAKAKGAVGVKRPTGEAPPEGPSIAEDVARQQAQQLIDSVDQGGQPAFVSQKLKATAAGVGVEVKGSDTPRDVVEKIRAAVAKSPVVSSSEQKSPEVPSDPLADAYFRKGITKRDQQIHGRVITGEPMEDIAKDLGMKNRQAVHAALKRVDEKLPEQFRSAEMQKQLKLREAEGQPPQPEGATTASLRANAEKIAREQQTKLAEAADVEFKRAAELPHGDYAAEQRARLGPAAKPIERTLYESQKRTEFGRDRLTEYGRENLLRRSWGATTLFDYIVSRGGLNRESLKANGQDVEALMNESGLPKELFATKRGVKIDELADEFFGEDKGIESGFPFGRLADSSQGPDRIMALIRDHAMLESGGWHEHLAEVADKLLELEQRNARQKAVRSQDSESDIEEAVRSGQEAANAQEPRDEGPQESDVGADHGDFAFGFGAPVAESERGAGPGEPAAVGGIPGLPFTETEQRAQAPTPQLTALAKEQTARERAALGLEQVPESVRQANKETWDKALLQIQADPTTPDRLLAELEKNPRPVNRVEAAVLLQRRVAIANELRRARETKGVSLGGGLETLIEQSRRTSELLGMRERFDRAIAKAGSELGGALQFYRQLAAEDFSLGGLLQSAESAKGGPLTEAETAKITELAAKIESLQGKLEAAEKYAAARSAPKEPEPGLFKKIGGWFKDIFGTKPDRGRGSKVWEFADRLEKEAVAALPKEMLFSGFDPTMIMPMSKYVAAKIIKTGYTFADYSKAIVGKFGDAVKPHMEDIWKRAEAEAEQARSATKPVPEARVDLNRAKRDAKAEVTRIKEASAPLPQKVFRGVTETLDTARAIMTSMDFSAVLRQAGFVAFGHPIKVARALPEMFRATVSEYSADLARDAIDQRANGPLYKRAGLYIADPHGPVSAQEESFAGRWVKKIPGIAASERAYTTVLNRVRADLFDSLASSRSAKARMSDPELKVIADFVNTATGRGSLGGLEKAASTLSRVFFSPRFVASRFQLLAGTPLYGGTMSTRQAIAKEYARTAIGLGVFYGATALAAQALGANKDQFSLSFDPRSSDFGKIKMGNTRIDPLFGLSQTAVLESRVLSGKTKSSTTGEVSNLREPAFGKQNTFDVMSRFVRSKLAPVPGAAIDLASGSNVVGQPVTPLGKAGELATPIAIGDIVTAIKDQGVPAGLAGAIASVFGMGVQSYSPTKHTAVPASRR